MSGYVVMARRQGLKAQMGRMTQIYPVEYLVTTRGITGSWEQSPRRATVFTFDMANKAANDYNNKKALAGAPKQVIRDPLSRTPNIVDQSGRRAIDATNYFWNTVATFKKVADPGPEAERMWASLKSRGRLDHKSDYGSQYVVVGDTLYRYADHWGTFATVTWYLSPPPMKIRPKPGGVFTGKDLGYSIGMVRFSEMKLK